jgi:hypothetical protein
MNQATIFINYRRQDSQWQTETLYNRLLGYFDKNSIFKDISTIEAGDNYNQAIGNALESCQILLVIIGEKWLIVQDINGQRRLEDPNDLVRMEIAHALKRGIKVIPVLFDGIKMPEPNQLPADLQALSGYQGIPIDNNYLEAGIGRLTEVIKKTIEQLTRTTVPPTPPQPPPFINKPDIIEVIKPLPQPYSVAGIVWSVIAVIVVLILTSMYFGINRRVSGYGRPFNLFSIALLLGVLFITLNLGKDRLSKSWITAISTTLLFMIILLSVSGGVPAFIYKAAAVISALIIFILILTRKYLASQILTGIFLFSISLYLAYYLYQSVIF